MTGTTYIRFEYYEWCVNSVIYSICYGMLLYCCAFNVLGVGREFYIYISLVVICCVFVCFAASTFSSWYACILYQSIRIHVCSIFYVIIMFIDNTNIHLERYYRGWLVVGQTNCARIRIPRRVSVLHRDVAKSHMFHAQLLLQSCRYRASGRYF